jgi:membrane protein YdbS with pleckstrin-like domain
VTPTPSPLDPWPDTVTWRPVSLRLILIEELRLAAGAAVPVLAGVLAAVTTGWTGWWWVAAAIVLVAVARALVIVRSVRSWGYAERADDLLVRHGLWTRRLSIVPYARMQFVDVTAGPVERLARLATVQLHTAAAHSDARVPGLPPAEAARLRDRLTALGEIRSEGL